MATLTRSITNASSTNSLRIVIDGYDPTGAVTLAPSATLDLLTIIPVEALHSMQAELTNLVTAGFCTVATSIDSSALYEGAILNYLALISPDTKIVFNPTTASAVHGVGASIAVQVENASNVVDPFVSPITAKVVAISTSTGTPSLNGLLAAASPLTVSGTLSSSTYTVADNTGWTAGDTITQGAATTTVASLGGTTTIVLTSNVGFSTGTITNTSVVAVPVSTAAGVASVLVTSASAGTTHLVIAQPSVSLTSSSACAVTLS